jgi:hypothetical protein
MVTRLVWLAVALLATALVWRLAVSPPPGDPRSLEDYWPSVGLELSAGEIQRAFDDPPWWDFRSGLSWLLVVTPDCSWCLALDTELEELAMLAACKG